jgi:glc operon protein GlcG
MAEKLGLKEARAIVDAMLKAPAERSLKFSVAVVDAGGDLIHIVRIDGASALNARMSYNKAYMATKQCLNPDGSAS